MIDKVIQSIRAGFDKITDTRRNNLSYPLADMLSLAFSVFHLKDPSLSFFKEKYDVRAENLKRVYGINSLPGDTALRQSIDQVKPIDLQGLFRPQMEFLSSKGVLKDREVLGEYTAVSVDGTQHYCSGTKGCPQCLTKNHRNGKTTYYHQLLGAVAVHPDQSTVFPVACEAIVRQDGNTKNDCELNASKRIIPQIRESLGEATKIIAIFDALYINGPHIKALADETISYIIGTKGGTYVDIQVEELVRQNKLPTKTWVINGRKCTTKFANGLILNGQNQDILTNYFEYEETNIQTGERIFYSTWVTDIEINEQNIEELVKIARSRWKIENETFNTLKNQGYHLEHNYGHGKENLATNFAILTFLAFLTDQIAQHLDKDFQAAKASCKTFKSLWESIRSVFYLLPTMSMNAVHRFIIKRQQIKMPALE